MAVFAIPNPKKTTVVDFPIEKIKSSINNLNLITKSYTFTSSNEIFNQYTFSAFELLSLGVYVDINLNKINENSTEITVEIRRKVGSFNQAWEITKANDHLEAVYKHIANITAKSDEEIEQLKNELLEKNKPKKNNESEQNKKLKPWKIIVLLFLGFVIYKACSSSSSTIGKYTKTELPENFTYNITKDDSEQNVDKNQLYVEISEKINEGQIATLASELYDSKPAKERTYIFYNIKGHNDKMSWAISHFNPELEITINGSSPEEDEKMLNVAKETKGKILGIFSEQGYTGCYFVVVENSKDFFVNQIYKNGEVAEQKMIRTETKNGVKFSPNNGEKQNEYYILRENSLEFYNGKNENFTTASIVK